MILRERKDTLLLFSLLSPLSSLLSTRRSPRSLHTLRQRLTFTLTITTFFFFFGFPQVVLVNFYADWCRFSKMVEPALEQAARLLGDSVNARIARLDCEDPRKNHNTHTLLHTQHTWEMGREEGERRGGKKKKTEGRLDCEDCSKNTHACGVGGGLVKMFVTEPCVCVRGER
jgi:thiol-disulfide isomerase/thioredoxin